MIGMRRVFCLVIGIVPFFCIAQERMHQSDVFLVTIDTLRADHVHCYGYDRIRTPALDSLAQDGIRFSQAFTPSPITNSSHASIFTGLLPSAHGVTDFAIPLLPTHPTWADLLRREGYRTAGFIGSVMLDSATLAPGFDSGFEYYDNFPAKTSGKSRWGRLERRAFDVVQRAEGWLGANPTGPHFMWLHFYDPHDPYEPPPPYAQVYKGHLYDGEIAYADSALGHFLAFLKTRGLYRNSLIVVVGDHGEGLGEHHEDTHGIFLYDSTLHVPLILKLPTEGNAGQVVEAQVRTTDILPTVLDLVRVRQTPKMDGESLQPYFSAGETSGRNAYGETDYPLRFGWAPIRSLRMKESLFVEAPHPEFYDLRADPEEVENRYEPWNEDVQKFRQTLAIQRARAPSTPSGGSVGPRTIAELRALGYLGQADVGSSTNVPEPSLLADPKERIEEQNLVHRAMLAGEQDRPVEARQALAKLLQLDPESYFALRTLGEWELETGAFQAAAKHLQTAFTLHPGDASLALLAGKALEQTHDLAGARDALEASLKLSPGQFEARLRLGQIYLSLKDNNAAEDQFAAALLIQPGNNRALFWMARAKAAKSYLRHAYPAVAHHP